MSLGQSAQFFSVVAAKLLRKMEQEPWRFVFALGQWSAILRYQICILRPMPRCMDVSCGGWGEEDP